MIDILCNNRLLPRNDISNLMINNHCQLMFCIHNHTHMCAGVTMTSTFWLLVEATQLEVPLLLASGDPLYLCCVAVAPLLNVSHVESDWTRKPNGLHPAPALRWAFYIYSVHFFGYFKHAVCRNMHAKRLYFIGMFESYTQPIVNSIIKLP